MKKFLSFITIITIFFFQNLYAQGSNALISGLPIKAGGEKGIAPLFLHGAPQGAAFIDQSEYPNIFAKAIFGIEAPSELYRFEYLYTRNDGHLIYSKAIQLSHPWENKSAPSNGRIFNLDNKVIGLWLESNRKIIITEFNKEKEAFVKSGEISLSGDLSRTLDMEVSSLGNNVLEIILLRSDGKSYGPTQNEEKTLSLYDGAGSYRGKLSLSGLYSFKINIKNLKQISNIERKYPNDNVVISGSRVVKVALEKEDLNGFVVTNSIGAIKYLPSKNKVDKLSEVKHVFKNNNEVLAHPTHGARAVSFGSASNPKQDLLISGERAIYYYHFSGEITKNGSPIYNEPLKILQEKTDLYAGSLTVPNVVDWNGDGTLDIVSGNSEGRLLYFKNNGTNVNPNFAYPEELKSGGEPICFRPGYNIVQGPMEAAWGYLCPTVFDWNNDGLLDIVFSGSRAKFEVMLNKGSKVEPELDRPVTLRIDNMELPGTWRVRPGVAKINGRNAIVILDTEDAVHLYWQVGDYSVEDGGKLLMEDGTAITHHSKEKQSLGQRGRAKFQLVDWDNDGILDLIIGTSKRSAFPNPERGMPYARYAKNELGLEVLFMKNTGTNENMKFSEPLQFQLKGKDLYLGTHSYGPYACELGDISKGLNLVVGVESGKFYFFERKDLTTIGF